MTITDRFAYSVAMISVHDALTTILDTIPTLGGERVGLLQAVGRVLAEEVRSEREVPPFANSAMDGYAVRWDDVHDAGAEQPIALDVLEVIQAGAMPTQTVTAGTASKIMTGAVIPPGADTVIRVEDTEEQGGRVWVKRPERPGTHIRAGGEDIRRGQVVLGNGRVLRPADIGLLASVGRSTALVRQRPRVAILSTGNELVEVDEALRPGQIVNSNAYTLAAAVQEAGGQPVPLAIARDTLEEIRAALSEAVRHDVVLSTGGVSVGDFDFVKAAMDELGIRRLFWQVAQRPGKPLTFGLLRERPYFGLPGNPVSALVCFYLYVRPALGRMMGQEKLFPPVVSATVGEDIPKAKGLTEFVRCRLTCTDGHYAVHSTGSQSSGVLSSLSLGEGLAIGPPELALLPKGMSVKVMVLDADQFAG
ncbi:MAG TPA: gephyrin-like molybdotransferase Glp, partial [Candidatus Binatia bacterium]|nr:gephyrin-like molybdotransferase Glp [Candidatus Binatia bacterium]